jgi:hypothetical protein
MKTKFLVLAMALLFASCARIPIQSIDLVTIIHDEGERMHQLNTALTNNLFAEKRQKIDDFIRLEYTPEFIEKITANIPENIDVKQELPGILASMIPVINERRDAMQSALELNRIKVIDKLNADFKDYEDACHELKTFLESAIKVDEERKKLEQQASGLTGNKIDFEKLEVSIDSFIQDSGDWGQNISNLNENVNALINK